MEGSMPPWYSDIRDSRIKRWRVGVGENQGGDGRGSPSGGDEAKRDGAERRIQRQGGNLEV